ncbi:MAG: PH domain-containing protein [Nitratireductor sp.]
MSNSEQANTQIDKSAAGNASEDNTIARNAHLSQDVTVAELERGDVKPRVREVEDDAAIEVADKMGKPTYASHWQIFIPTLVIFLAYGLGLIVLFSMGMTSSALFRLGAIVLGVGVPLIAVHAFLRFSTVRLQFLETHLRYHSGWPSDASVDVPYELISSLDVRRGLAGRLFGGGTIVIKLTTGNRIAIADVFDPLGAQTEFVSLRKS